MSLFKSELTVFFYLVLNKHMCSCTAPNVSLLFLEATLNTRHLYHTPKLE